MAPQRQLKLSRMHKLLNRKNDCPEAEPKEVLTLTRLSETQAQPFTETRLGKLPAELRGLIYHELVATPPTHAGQELTTRVVRAESLAQHRLATPATLFVHLKASTTAVLKTCRQIYKEAQPVFFARTSYYAANEKELEQLIDLMFQYWFHSPLRTNGITSLCVKDIVSSSVVGKGLSNFMWCDAQFEGWESLQKIYLCMRVGEEIGYIAFLFSIPRMVCGVIEFLDDSHWRLRLQRPEEEWKTQYACFFTKAYHQGKGDIELSLADIRTQEKLLERDSRVPGLEKGQERLVEVDIEGPLEKCMPWEMKVMMDRFCDLSVES